MALQSEFICWCDERRIVTITREQSLFWAPAPSPEQKPKVPNCMRCLCFRAGSQCSKGVGYYTQLVWQNTTHVGCGWTQFQYRGFPVIKWQRWLATISLLTPLSLCLHAVLSRDISRTSSSVITARPPTSGATRSTISRRLRVPARVLTVTRRRGCARQTRGTAAGRAGLAGAPVAGPVAGGWGRGPGSARPRQLTGRGLSRAGCARESGRRRRAAATGSVRTGASGSPGVSAALSAGGGREPDRELVTARTSEWVSPACSGLSCPARGQQRRERSARRSPAVPGLSGRPGPSVPSPVGGEAGPESGSAGRAETTGTVRVRTSSRRAAISRTARPGQSGAASLPAAGHAGEEWGVRWGSVFSRSSGPASRRARERQSWLRSVTLTPVLPGQTGQPGHNAPGKHSQNLLSAERLPPIALFNWDNQILGHRNVACTSLVKLVSKSWNSFSTYIFRIKKYLDVLKPFNT